MREVLCLIQMKILSQVFLLRTPSERQWQGGSLDKTLGIRLKVSREGGRKEADTTPRGPHPATLLFCIFVRGNTKCVDTQSQYRFSPNIAAQYSSAKIYKFCSPLPAVSDKLPFFPPAPILRMVRVGERRAVLCSSVLAQYLQRQNVKRMKIIPRLSVSP